TRAQWGADERWRRCCPRYAQTVEVAFVHHTVNPNSYTAAQAPGMIRAIYRYHRFNLDYDDIAYNFLVDRFGVVYEGRAGGTGATVIGAHTEGMNSKTTGIALLGTFSSAYPSPQMMIALQKLLAWKLDVHHIPPAGVVPMTSTGSAKLRRGQTVNMPRIAGHRDAQATDCPGNAVYNQLGRIRTTIQPWGAPKFYLNSSGRVLRADGDLADETVPVKVWMSSSLDWRITFADASGNARKTFTGTGTVADVVWDGRDAVTGAVARTGVGQIRIEASNSSGVAATPAAVPLYVVADHLPGTVLHGEAGRVLLEADGIARPIPSDAVFASWYRDAEAVPATAAELARYRTTLPISFRDGTLVRTPDGAYHFIAEGRRRPFASSAVFDALGYTEEAALPVTQADIEAIPQGTPIADAAIHPNGAVVRDASEVLWLIENGARRRVPNTAVRRSWFRDAEIVPATTGDATLPEGTTLGFRPGSLFRTSEGIRWQMTGGTRKSYYDPWYFAAFGYPSGAALSAEWSEILIWPYGGQIK
ncbi:MAG: peptidoglycan recognition protein family protein, partial [Actinomycetota bacterium]